jgi:hypothetical protein
MQPETKLQKKMARRLRSRGAWVRKMHGGPSGRGLPDFLGCYRGVFFAIEVKVPGREGTLTEHQDAGLRAIARAGGIACVFTRVVSCDLLLARIDRMASETVCGCKWTQLTYEPCERHSP